MRKKKWYEPYLQYYEQPFDQVPPKIVEEVRLRLQQQREAVALLQQRGTTLPVVASVILIAHNEETHLLSCLWSLCRNECDFPIEILAVNNNSTDATEEVLRQLGVTYFNEPKKGPGHARQCGLDRAQGKYHLCIDADTMYPPHYISTHVHELMKPGVACTYGLWSFIRNEEHARWGLWLYESVRNVHLRLQASKRPELCVRGMAFGFNTEQGREFGFRTDIIRGEDGYLALQLKKHGKLVFIRKRKAQVLTEYNAAGAAGTLFSTFKVRVAQALKNIGGLLFKKTTYQDKESNLLK